MQEPDNGVAISMEKETTVRVLYDNEAIYISAILKDNEPDKILKEITGSKRGKIYVFDTYIKLFN